MLSRGIDFRFGRVTDISQPDPGARPGPDLLALCGGRRWRLVFAWFWVPETKGRSLEESKCTGGQTGTPTRLVPNRPPRGKALP